MNIGDEAAKAVTVTHIEYDGYYVLINGLLHSSMPRFEYEESAEKLAAYLRLTLAAFARRCVEAEREACAKVICTYCGSGHQVKTGTFRYSAGVDGMIKTEGDYHHIVAGVHEWDVPCKAQAIRQRGIGDKQ